MWNRVKNWFSTAAFEQSLENLHKYTPVPLFWLFGKTQSGKTSIVKFLTGADEAEIGQGWKPCTRFSRQYNFPTAEAPLLSFLDTRGLDEPGYDPAEDLDKFNEQAHVVIVTVKAMDHAQENVLKHLQRLRDAQPSRPVVLALTCLHEAYPQQQHPQPYPFPVYLGADKTTPLTREEMAAIPTDLQRSLDEQTKRFQGLFDQAVPIDLTPPVEGFTEPNYGGQQLKQALLAVMPAAYRQSLLNLDEAKRELQDIYAHRALPYIISYASLAATAGAFPIPWLDLLIIPAIQARLLAHLARLYGQPLSATRFMELAGTLGLGILTRQAVREVTKFIPFVGSVAGAALAGSTTFALGKAFCYYYSAVHQGHVPQAEDLKRYYEEQLTLAEKHLLLGKKEGQPQPTPQQLEAAGAHAS
jgi:uncharacterized protein (DUF697 family)